MRLVAILMLFSLSWWSEKKPLDLDTAKFPSPNGNLMATFEQRHDGWYYLDIKNSVTERVEGSVKVELTPIFSIKWTRDSKSIVVVGHVAHGSTIILFHVSGGIWSRYNFFPDDFSHDPNASRVLYKVAKTQADEHNVTATYELDVCDESDPDESHDKHYLVTVTIDPESNRVLDSKRVLVN